MLPLPPKVDARPVPLVVLLLSLLCVAGFLHALSLDAPALGAWVERWGLVSRALIRELRESGPGWRLVTPGSAVILHENLAHLCGNLFYLYLFGEVLEVALGRGRFLVLFGVSALAAAGVHVLVDPEAFRPALGASGAVSGLLGAYMVVRASPSVRDAWRPLGLAPGLFLALWALLVVFASWQGAEGYAGWAHVGGFVAGLGTCALLEPRVDASLAA